MYDILVLLLKYRKNTDLFSFISNFGALEMQPLVWKWDAEYNAVT